MKVKFVLLALAMSFSVGAEENGMGFDEVNMHVWWPIHTQCKEYMYTPPIAVTAEEKVAEYAHCMSVKYNQIRYDAQKKAEEKYQEL